MLYMPDHIDISKQDETLEKTTPKSVLEFFSNYQSRCGFYFFKTKKLSAAIIIPPKEEKKSYDQLAGSSLEEQNKIIELFSIMGSHGKIDLLMNHKKHLEQLGREISHVHPLKLLGVMFSTPNMKTYMDNIYNDYFKWKHFIEGFEPNMNHELMKDNLLQHIDDFARHVNIPTENIRPFFDKKDWKGLVKYLIYN